MNFVKVNDKYVNLEHVSSITKLPNRLALDMDCNSEVKKDGESKLISYYAYCDIKNAKQVLNHKYVLKNFIKAKNILINKNHITVVKFSPKKLRVIFNLSHSTTSAGYNNINRLTAKFIYADFDNQNEYDEYIKYIKNVLKLS